MLIKSVIPRDVAESWHDALDRQSRTLRTLRATPKTFASWIRDEVRLLGADAMVDLDLDFSKFTGSIVSGGTLLSRDRYC